MEDTRGWILAEEKTEEGLSIIRLKKIENSFEFEEFPERISIFWDFQKPDPNGSPSENDFDAMESFENAICDLIEADNDAVLSIIFTEPGYRQWVFYCQSVEGFIDYINNIPQKSEPFPIEIEHESDAAWEFYKSYAKHLVKA